jgi:hypothetical protein
MQTENTGSLLLLLLVMVGAYLSFFGFDVNRATEYTLGNAGELLVALAGNS